MLRDKFSCQYCGEQFSSAELTYDHVIPRSAGGRTVWDNILTCCVACNTKKQAQMPKWNAKKGHPLRPLKPPRQPTSHELLQAGLEFLDSSIKEDFGSFLYWEQELETEEEGE